MTECCFGPSECEISRRIAYVCLVDGCDEVLMMRRDLVLMLAMVIIITRG